MVTIIDDREPIYDTDDYEVVLMGVSTHNMLMGGFQKKMGIKYPIVEKVNDSTPYADKRKMGKIITIDDNTPIISLMYICTHPSIKGEYLDYNALKECLEKANNEFKGKKVMTTLLGGTNFDGKGDKEKCLEIIKESTKDLDLYIYVVEPITINEEIKRQRKYFSELKKKYKEDKETLDKIKEMANEMRKRTFLPMDTYRGRISKEKDDILNF